MAQTILSHYPGQLYITTNPHAGNDNSRSIPLKLALTRHNDEVSALLIQHMKSERCCCIIMNMIYNSVKIKIGCECETKKNSESVS